MTWPLWTVPVGRGSVCVCGTGPGFGEGGGWWSLSCPVAFLTLCSPWPLREGGTFRGTSRAEGLELQAERSAQWCLMQNYLHIIVIIY